MLYQLIITDTEVSHGDHREDFAIGFFRTEDEAKSVAARYLGSVPGFCDYPCEAKIVPREVKGDIADGRVRIVEGWDVNGELDEVNVIESACYASEKQAKAALREMERKYERDEWAIGEYTVGRAEWAEGFARTTQQGLPETDGLI